MSQLGLFFPIYGKIRNVPNHQPALLLVILLLLGMKKIPLSARFSVQTHLDSADSACASMATVEVDRPSRSLHNKWCTGPAHFENMFLSCLGFVMKRVRLGKNKNNYCCCISGSKKCIQMTQDKTDPNIITIHLL